MLAVAVAFAIPAMAQGPNWAPTSDVLGAHLNYGRGCTACHAPHSGARGNGIATSDTTSGDQILWGQDVAPLFNKTITSAGNTIEVLPSSMAATTPDVNGLLTCLSCHDGNYATGAMMKNIVYETVPSTYASQNIPTLLGRDGNSPNGDYLNDHPVGLNAVIACGGRDWDCTITSTGTIQMTGPNSAQFFKNYGFFVSPKAYNSTPTVQCTTCHNQHVMNVTKVTAAKSGLPAGTYATMFFVRGPYNPASGTAGSNQTAQFCRQCHAGMANEMNNGGSIPTVF
jgi:hypothetical protein